MENLDGTVIATALPQMAESFGVSAIQLSIAITAMPEKEERIIARRLEEFEVNMKATLDGIKRLAEQTS